MFNMSPEDHYKDAMQQIEERVQDAEHQRLARAMRRAEHADRPSLFLRSQHLMSELRYKVSRIAGQEQREPYPIQVRAR